MSKFNDQTVVAAFQPYLQSEEFLGNAAYCIKRPPELIGCLISLLGMLPDILFRSLLSKYYVVGLTNRRLIVLRLASRFGGNIRAAEVLAYSLDQLPEIQANFGAFATGLVIKDPARPFKVVFPMAGVPDNHKRGRMIANKLLSDWQQRQLRVSEEVSQPQAIRGVAPLSSSVPAGSAHFNVQSPPVTYVPQSSHKAFGCFGAATITVGAGVFLLFAMGFLGFLLDKTKSSEDVTAGLIGLFVILLFSATLIAIGIYLVVHGRKEKAAAVLRERTWQNRIVSEQTNSQLSQPQRVTGREEFSQTTSLWAKDQQTATPEPPMSRAEAEEKIIEIARRTVPPASELFYYFICTGNQSLIKTYHDLFRVGAPAYGGSAAYYRADQSQLSGRQAEATAASLLFAGQQSMGSTVNEVSSVSDVLAELSVSAYGSVFISFVTVGPTGREWVRNVYATLLGEAVGQGILPFSMYTTASKDAAQFLLDSFSVVSAS